MAKVKFATALNCMDGRVQEPLTAWIKQQLMADYVDMITEPGMDHIFCDCSNTLTDYVIQKIKISIEKHGSETIVLAGHYDCAGNCVCDDDHRQEVLTSTANICLIFPALRVIGIFINEQWQVEVLRDCLPA